jgi:hypothetical protein
MSWQLSHKDNQYRIWSTVSDQYITDWISQEEALAVWYDSALVDFKKKVIEHYLKFPHFWSDRDSHGYIKDDVANERYGQWLHELSEMPDEENYRQFVDEWYEKINAELEGKL